MRAIAASYLRTDPDTKTETLVDLPARIKLWTDLDGSRLYLPIAIDVNLGGTSSLHRAKNAIRRHFRVASRKDMRWTEI